MPPWRSGLEPTQAPFSAAPAKHINVTQTNTELALRASNKGGLNSVSKNHLSFRCQKRNHGWNGSESPRPHMEDETVARTSAAGSPNTLDPMHGLRLTIREDAAPRNKTIYKTACSDGPNSGSGKPSQNRLRSKGPP